MNVLLKRYSNLCHWSTSTKQGGGNWEIVTGLTVSMHSVGIIDRRLETIAKPPNTLPLCYVKNWWCII